MLLFVTGMTYTPGLHIIAEFDSNNTAILTSSASFKKYIDNAISANGLNKLGEFYHEFQGGGFTAVVCLTESHIAIHTWPEYGRVTYDVFLSNYQNVNNGKAELIAQGLEELFEAFNTNQNRIER